MYTLLQGEKNRDRQVTEGIDTANTGPRHTKGSWDDYILTIYFTKILFKIIISSFLPSEWFPQQNFLHILFASPVPSRPSEWTFECEKSSTCTLTSPVKLCKKHGSSNELNTEHKSSIKHADAMLVSGSKDDFVRHSTHPCTQRHQKKNKGGHVFVSSPTKIHYHSWMTDKPISFKILW